MPTETETDTDTLPPTRRIEELAHSDLVDYIQTAIIDFQEAIRADTEPIAQVSAVHIVGSVLTADFRPDESDVDLVVVVDTEPVAELAENFWRSWQDRYATSPELQKQIDIPYTKLDVVDVVSTDRASETLIDPHRQLWSRR